MLTLRDYAPEARSILCDDVKRIRIWSTIDETRRLFDAGILDGGRTTLDSAPVAFARAVAKFVQSLGYEAGVCLNPRYRIGVDTGAKLFVVPVSTAVENATRDVIKEICACQVFLIDHTGSDSVEATNDALETSTAIQRSIFERDLLDAKQLWRIESAIIYGATTIGNGQIDGLFDSSDFEERFVVKSPLVITGCRYLQRS